MSNAINELIEAKKAVCEGLKNTVEGIAKAFPCIEASVDEIYVNDTEDGSVYSIKISVYIKKQVNDTTNHIR